MSIFLSKSEQDTVVFHIFKSMKYPFRLFISLTIIIGGLLIQYFTFSLAPGIFLVLSGNLLLLVKGYNNMIKLGHYTPYTKWEKVDSTKLDDITDMHRKMKQWDRSAIDITSGWGVFLFLVLLFFMLIFYAQSTYFYNSYSIIATNMLVLLLPYWFTGAKKILTRPVLILKIGIIKQLLAGYKDYLSPHKIEYHMMLKGKKDKDEVLPEDVKFRVVLNNQGPDFLGLYGQVATNAVSGTNYPYFYVVLVAKPAFDIKSKTRNYSPPNGIIKEYTKQQDVDVLIIRQYTTRTSGYHTKPKVISAIFGEGLRLALQLNK